jgi:hypothetical protein
VCPGAAIAVTPGATEVSWSVGPIPASTSAHPVPSADEEAADGEPCLAVAVEQVLVAVGGGVPTEIAWPGDEGSLGYGVDDDVADLHVSRSLRSATFPLTYPADGVDAPCERPGELGPAGGGDEREATAVQDQEVDQGLLTQVVGQRSHGQLV